MDAGVLLAVGDGALGVWGALAEVYLRDVDPNVSVCIKRDVRICRLLVKRRERPRSPCQVDGPIANHEPYLDRR